MQLQINYRDLAGLKPHPSNARIHSRKQIDQIARSITAFGFNNPVLVDAEGAIVAGHGRVEAARKLGIEKVPTVRLDHLSAAQKRAYIIADNRLAENAGWDKALLQSELQGLLASEIDFEITDLGFETAEIDLMLADDTLAQEEQDELPDPETIPCVARPGDLWLLGDHRLLCGNALDPASFETLLGSDRANLLFADPPYNVPIGGHVSGLGRARHREFDMASGEMTSAQFTEFLKSALRQSASWSADGAIHFVCMDWRHMRELLDAGSEVYSELKNLCVWVKSNGGMGSLYRSQHELVAVYKVGRASHVNNVELGRHGRYRTNVWHYPGMNSFHDGRDEAIALHPTVKPTALVVDAIYDCSRRGDIVLDPFSGSGTTILAAERAGRRARAIEIDPRYVDVTLQRFLAAARKTPVNAVTGASFPGKSQEPASARSTDHG